MGIKVILKYLRLTTSNNTCTSNKELELVCKDPKYAYKYSTRKLACKDPAYSYLYARDIDKCAREDTRKAACKDPEYAYKYALYVDKCRRKM